MNDDDFDIEITSCKNNKENDELIITSPFKSKELKVKSNDFQNLTKTVSSNSKTQQQKLTKMQNYNLKTICHPLVKQNDQSISTLSNEKTINQKDESSLKISNETSKILVDQPTANSKQTWKIKAIIENKNFLIPIA